MAEADVYEKLAKNQFMAHKGSENERNDGNA